LLANFLNQSIAHRDTSVIHGMGKTKSGNESFKEQGTKSERPLKTS
jgi:hypothetical protein